ncbi:MAG: hypothetical protein Q8S73_27225 [Deltaproteobacteria bacterium]|nr:hypothetical protein [Deltaproteobacteria bacterium]
MRPPVDGRFGRVWCVDLIERTYTTWTGHDEAVTSLSVTPDRRDVVVAYEDGTVQRHELGGARVETLSVRHDDGSYAQLCARDDGRCVSLDFVGVRVWRLDDGHIETLIPREKWMEISENGCWCVRQEDGVRATLFELTRGTVVGHWTNPWEITVANVTDDGTVLIGDIRGQFTVLHIAGG